MPRPLVDPPQWTPTLTGPVAGDPRTSASVSAPLEALASRTQALRHRDHERPLIVEPGVSALELIGRQVTGGTDAPVHVIAVAEAVPAAPTLVIDLRIATSRLVEGDELRVVRIGPRSSSSSRRIEVRVWQGDGAQYGTVVLTDSDVEGLFRVGNFFGTLVWQVARRLVEDPTTLPRLETPTVECGTGEFDSLTVNDTLSASAATLDTATIHGGTATLASATVATLAAGAATVSGRLDVDGDGVFASVAQIGAARLESATVRQLALRPALIDCDDAARTAFVEGYDWVPGYFQSAYPGVAQTPQDPFWFGRATGDAIPDVVRSYNPSLPATIDDLIPAADREISQLQWFDYRYGIGRANRRLADTTNPLDPLAAWTTTNPAFTVTVQPDLAALWMIRPWGEGRPQALLSSIAPEGATVRIVFTRAPEDVRTAPTSLFVGERSLAAPWRMVDPSSPYVARAVTEMALGSWADFARVAGAWYLVAKGSL